jgi:3-carboxy-cis,cis-muconate cycloisomerase
MAAANQRPAGAWQSEWHALPQLFGLASGALREARQIAEGLVVDKARMRANLDLTGGLVFSDAVAARLAPKLGRHAAGALVEAAAATVRQTGRSFGKALAADRRIRNALGDDYRVDAEMQAALAAAAAATDRVLKDAAVTRRAIATRKRRR